MIACGSGSDSNGQAGGAGGSMQNAGGGAASPTSGLSGGGGALVMVGAGAAGESSATAGAAPNGGSGGASGSNTGGASGSAGASEATGGALHAGGNGGTGESAGTHAGGAPNTGGSAGGAGAGNTLPDKIVAGYYPNWTPAPVRIKDVESHYNLIYLFAATPVGGAPGTTGAITWTAPGDGQGAATNLNADIAYARATQHRKILLSVGGAGNGMSFPTRSKSQAFVDSVASWYDKLGGIDGIDWNTFEGNQAGSACN
jgi:hypothetical protein